MDPRCDFVMCFPAAPVTSLSDPAEVAALPRRQHLYLGETVPLLLVLRYREAAATDETAADSRWRERVGRLAAVTSACVAEKRQRRAADDPDRDRDTDRDGAPHPGWRPPGSFSRCTPLNTHTGSGSIPGAEPDKAPLVLDNQVIFFLSVSLAQLPVNTTKVKVTATVWRREEERVEVRENGYVNLLQLCSPSHTFRQDAETFFRAQVSTTLNVLPPPSVQCQQLTICGKHLTILKVLNLNSQEEVCVRDVKVLPNYNVAYLPVMPDGSVLLVDNVCHQSAEVTTASFHRVGSQSSPLPSMLSALEEQNFLFQLQLQDKAEEDSSQGLEVPLVAVVEWSTATLSCSRSISTCFSLPRIRLDRPGLVLTASGPAAVRPHQTFWVRYTLLNNLTDFLAVRLLWRSEAPPGGRRDPRVSAVVCRSPLSILGRCAKGSVVSFTVAFQILTTGVFELSQNMRLKLQFSASVAPPSPQKNVASPSTSSSSPAAGEPGYSPIFSKQPTKSPGGLNSAGRRGLVAPENIAKRECRVFVLPEPFDRSPGASGEPCVSA